MRSRSTFDWGKLLLLLNVLFFCVSGASAATLPKGQARLRELAVVPQLKASFHLEFTSETRIEDLVENASLAEQIQRAQKNVQHDPDNAAWQFQLGKLHQRNDDTNAARVCFERAATIARRVSDSRPGDGNNLTTLAEALAAMNRAGEAESLFRRATVVASNDWRCWVGLGRFLNQQSFAAICSGIPTNGSGADAGLNEVLDYPPVPEQMERAIQFRSEAYSCFQRANALGPNEAGALQARAFYMSRSNWVTTVIRHHRGEELLTPEQLVLNMAAFPGAAEIFQKIVATNPKAYKLVTWMAWVELCAVKASRPGIPVGRQLMLDEMPDQSRQVIQNAMQQLKALGEGVDRPVAVGALISLCALKTMLTEEKDLTADLQRAVALDPANDQAWEMLIAASAKTASPEQFSALCRKRLQSHPNSRNHLIVAKALYRQKKFKEATEHARESLQRDSNSVPAALMVAALDIRQGAALTEINKSLNVAKKLLETLSDEEEQTARLRELILNVAILYGLDENPAKARELLERILRANPDDEDAREILSALP